jgi:ADP-ribose pyrophosphatase
MLPIEKTLSSELIYDGRIIEVRRDTADLLGKTVSRELVIHHGGVCIAAFTEEDEIILVKQFRYAFHEPLIEIPAGKLEKNEDHRAAGIRELKEEIGATAETFEYLGVLYPSVAYLTEQIHIYEARGLTFGETHFDEDEHIEMMKVPFSEAVDMVLRNEIKDAKTAAAILMIRVQNTEYRKRTDSQKTE